LSIYFAVELEKKTIDKLKEKQLYLKQNSVSGDFSQPETFHITVLFCAGGNSGYQRDDYKKALDEMGRRFNPKPFDMKLQNFGKFPSRDGSAGDTFWVGVRDSFPLYELKKNLEETIQSMQVKIENAQFKGYTPHITMGYNVILKDSFNDLKFDDNDSFTVKSLCLWDGFKANEAHVYNKVHELFFK
jgi:2'-5' RNA ligase